MRYDDCVILLFAKAPVAGKVNTRLISDIGLQAATELQLELIHNRLTMLTNAKLCDVRLMCAPDQQHKTFLQCKKQYSINLFNQVGEDLGERMFHGVLAALQQYKYCIVVGTDAPALDVARINQAIDSLRETDVVIVPAEDGGYVLIAMRQAHQFLFQNISWGSAEVMQQSRNKLNENNVSLKELASCWDVDRLEDYQRYLAMENR